MAHSHPEPPLPEPKAGQAYVEVSALEAGIIKLPLQLFVQGAKPEEISTCPSLAFSLRHKPSDTHLLFDLGLRRDVEKLAPAAQGLITKWMPVEVPQSVDESLRKGGILPENVETVILSHLHFDHVGDPSAFPKAAFVVGEGSRELLDNGFPVKAESDILQETIPVERTRFLTSADFDTSIGPFPRAHDYFGDGSLFIIDAVGHLAGHINILARTSPTGSWIYLGGDTAHDTRLLTGEKEVAFLVDPASGHVHCAHRDKAEAVEHIRRVGSLLKVPGVHVLLAHDWEWYEQNKGGDAFLPGIIPPKTF